MKERINRLARGIIDQEKPEMTWQPEVAEEIVRADGVSGHELIVSSANGLNVKGFVYSSSARVKIPESGNSFGGLRNRIRYDVDTSYLAPGDRIEGKFILVTNCGEQEIPYEFTVDSGAPGERLSDLKTPKDFLRIAEQDQDTALRLLGYRDFIDAPFMQDLHIRTVYDGLANHGSRQNFMEEFLIAIGVKKPVRLMTDGAPREYSDPAERIEDTIVIRCDSWGYFSLEAESDSDFILLPKKSATEQDFRDGALRLPFTVLPDHLHQGINMGAIRIRSTLLNVSIPVTVRISADRNRDERVCADNEVVGIFTEALESLKNGETGTQMAEKIRRRIDRLEAIDGEHKNLPIYRLCADTLDEKRSTKQFMSDMREAGMSGNRSGGSAGDSYLAMLEACGMFDGDDDGIALYSMLERVFDRGSRSPFLYQRVLQIFEVHPEIMREADDLTVLTGWYAVRKADISKEMAFRLAALVEERRDYFAPAVSLMKKLYEKYPDDRILTAIVRMLIRGDRREEKDFPWYERAVKHDISLTKLYDYFLYSLPEAYDRLLPESVLIYFTYAQNLERESREVLYYNILRYAAPDSRILEDYRPMMERAALEELFEGRINRKLAVLYRATIYDEMIDAQLARILPPILRSARITCRNPQMKYVVVVHEELLTEDAYPLKRGKAYVPLFGDRDVILFQDSYGNRYASVKYECTPAMGNIDATLAACYARCPDNPILQADACVRAMEKDEIGAEEAEILTRADETLELHPLFRAKMRAVLIRYYRKNAGKGNDSLRDGDIRYLLSLDPSRLTQEDRTMICAILVESGRLSEAWEMMEKYILTGLSDELTAVLVSHLILERLFEENGLLLHLAFRLGERDREDSVILDYLCEHFNGTIPQMMGILRKALRSHVETYDMEERIVAQMLFTGQTEKMDSVFELYASGEHTSENIVRAYFTVRCREYFLENRNPGDRMFQYLEGLVDATAEKEKLPDIYMLALTRYYATLPDLDHAQRAICQTLVNALIDEGRVFAYYKELAKFILVPGDIMDKEIVEYHGKKDIVPYLQLRILPEEEEFHYEDMKTVYPGIYIHEKVLFEGEIMEYRIEEVQDGEKTIVEEGSVSCREVRTIAPGNRFANLNEMSLSAEMKSDRGLRDKMIEYIKKDAAVEVLFPLQ